MSLGIAFKGPEGVVLAADSRVTLNATSVTGDHFTVHFDNATKLLALEGQPYVGIVTYGAGAIGQPDPRTAHGFMPEFEAELWRKHGVQRLTVAQVAEELGAFFVQQWNQRGMPPPGTPGVASMVFLVAGFDEGDAYGKVFEVTVPDNPTPAEQSPGDFGVTFGGQHELVQRLLGGVDLRASAIAKDELGLTDDQVRALAERWRNELTLTVPYQFLPLQDCVDLSTFLVHMTSAVQGWMIALRGVGGAVEVATITRMDGFKAIQQRRIEVRE